MQLVRLRKDSAGRSTVLITPVAVRSGWVRIVYVDGMVDWVMEQRMAGLHRKALVQLVLTVGLEEQRMGNQLQSKLVVEWVFWIAAESP
jgi:hypothetical protein